MIVALPSASVAKLPIYGEKTNTCLFLFLCRPCDEASWAARASIEGMKTGVDIFDLSFPEYARTA